MNENIDIKMDEFFIDIGNGLRISRKSDINLINLHKLTTDINLRNHYIDIIINLLKEKCEKPTHVLALESGGYLLGAILADRLNLKYTIARKQNKLPPPVYTTTYSMEYREYNQMEILTDSFDKNDKILIVDDIIVTGGTIKGAINLINQIGSKIIGAACFSLLHNSELSLNIPLIYASYINNNINKMNFLDIKQINNNYPLILLCGKSFSGKDTVCKELLNNLLSYKRISIADTMKKKFIKKYNIDVFNRDIKEKNRIKLMEFTHNYELKYWLKKTNYVEKCIITDIRTLEEINYIKQLFKNILIIRLNVFNDERIKRGYISNDKFDNSYLECELDNYNFDYTFNNNNFDDLKHIIKFLLNQLIE